MTRRKFRVKPRVQKDERYIYLIDGVQTTERMWGLGLEEHAKYEVEVVKK